MKGKRNAWKDFTNSNHSSSAKNAEMGWKKNPCFQQSPPRGRELIFVLPSTKEQGVPPPRLFPLDGHFKSFAFYFQLQRLCNSHTCHRTVLFHTILERNTQIFIAYVDLTCIVLCHKYSLIFLPFLSGLPDISIPAFPQVFPKSTRSVQHTTWGNHQITTELSAPADKQSHTETPAPL